MENISVFDIFKIGIGPSSSHTLGPWYAAKQSIEKIRRSGSLQDVVHVSVHLYGSLAKTGKGHGTDIAVMLGLMGKDPKSFPTEQLNGVIQQIKDEESLSLSPTQSLPFSPKKDIVFHFDQTLPFHPNGMEVIWKFSTHETKEETYYSIGGRLCRSGRKV